MLIFMGARFFYGPYCVWRLSDFKVSPSDLEGGLYCICFVDMVMGGI